MKENQGFFLGIFKVQGFLFKSNDDAQEVPHGTQGSHLGFIAYDAIL